MNGQGSALRPVSILASLFWLTACGSTGDGVEDRADSSGDAATVSTSDALFEHIRADGPGCSAAVNRDGEIVYVAAFGLASLHEPVPFTTATVLDIASASKQFTATAIGLLVLEGSLQLDDPVSRYLDELPAWSTEVTVGDLVHHTSSIADYTELFADAGIDASEPTAQPDAVAAISGSDLAGEPGVGFEYSNSNYVLLAEIVEAVTGSRLDVFLRDEVFAPLDIDAEVSPDPSGRDVARGYIDDDGWIEASSRWAQLGDGSVYTTPEQLALWATEYWDPQLHDGELDALRFAGAADTGDASRYGLGVESSGTGAGQRITHSGSWAGIETEFVVAPQQQLAVVVSCNSPDLGNPADLGDQLADAWL